MRFAFIAKHRHIWPVSWLCDVLEVSRPGFHAWLDRPISNRAILDAKLVTAIDTSFKASDRTYGARRVWHEVLEEGLYLRPSPDLAADAPECVESTTKTARKASKTMANGRSSPTTSSTAISKRIARTRSGWPTSPKSGPPKAGCMWQSCWTCLLAGSWAGR